MRRICQEILGRCLYLAMAVAVIAVVNFSGWMICEGLMESSYQVVFSGIVFEVIGVGFAVWAEMFTLAPWRDMVSTKRLCRETVSR